MLREEALHFVRQLTESVNSHDTARLLQFYAENAVIVSPVAGKIAGRVAIAKWWNEVFSRFPDWAAEVSEVLVDGDRVAFIGNATATDKNGWFGQIATGERIEYRATIILTFSQGKIIREERNYDLSGVLQRLEKARLDQELKLAADVQRALLSRTRVATSFCEAVADSIPCRSIGGDFFELIDLPSGGLGIALGDVAGKGPSSALLAAMLQGMLTVAVQNERSPSSVLRDLNGWLLRRRVEPRFASFAYGMLSSDGRFVYSLAGHNPPVMVTGDGIRRLTSGGPVLGAFDQSIFEEGTMYLGEGDTLVLFSDGITEACDIGNQEFGEHRLLSSLTGSDRESPSEVLNRILRSVKEFCQGALQSDDMTVLVSRFVGREPGIQIQPNGLIPRL
jgi:serine phosphatase RsbU (regulator of sigma subunit)